MAKVKPTWLTTHKHIRRMMFACMGAAGLAGAVLLFGNDRAWSVVVAVGDKFGLPIPMNACSDSTLLPIQPKHTKEAMK